MPSIGVAANHFTRRRSLAMAIISTANSFGGFVFSVIFSHFLRGHVGFAMGIRIGGFICFGCLGLAQVLMHQYLKAKSPTSQTSSKITGDNPAAACQAPPSSSSTVCKNQPYVPTVLCGFVFSLGLFYSIFNVQLFAREEGFASPKLSGWLLGITDLSSCVGRVVLTYLGDRSACDDNVLVEEFCGYYGLLCALWCLFWRSLRASIPCRVILGTQTGAPQVCV